MVWPQTHVTWVYSYSSRVGLFWLPQHDHQWKLWVCFQDKCPHTIWCFVTSTVISWVGPMYTHVQQHLVLSLLSSPVFSSLHLQNPLFLLCLIMLSLLLLFSLIKLLVSLPSLHSSQVLNQLFLLPLLILFSCWYYKNSPIFWV